MGNAHEHVRLPQSMLISGKVCWTVFFMLVDCCGVNAPLISAAVTLKRIRMCLQSAWQIVSDYMEGLKGYPKKDEAWHCWS